MTTLEVKDLHASVISAEGGADIEILKGVNLTVKSGETHAVMGPNGSGKSTLSYAIAGHPKYTVTSGSITLDGENVLEMSIDERAGHRPGVQRAQCQRGLLGWREEAPRDPATRAAQAEDRDSRRDRLRTRRRRAARRQRGRQPVRRSRTRWRAADHPLHPHPALHPAAVRPRVRRWPDRRVGRPRARRRTRGERLRALHAGRGRRSLT